MEWLDHLSLALTERRYRSASFRIPEADLEQTLKPYIVRELDASDPEWVQTIKKTTRKIEKLEANKTPRNTARVAEDYERIWARGISYAPDSIGPVLWNGRLMMLRGVGGKAISRLYLYRVVAHDHPLTVLEVGCGRGFNLALLANRFPHLKLTGIDLTLAGPEVGRNLAAGELPEDLASMSPEPLLSRTAHQKITFMQGNAAELPFPDRSFDLVYTVHALEQMDEIAPKALSEIARVAKKRVIFIEPFRDWNATGIRRRYTEAMGYLSLRVKDLKRYGLKPEFVSSSNVPAKAHLGSGVVIASVAERSLAQCIVG